LAEALAGECEDKPVCLEKESSFGSTTRREPWWEKTFLSSGIAGIVGEWEKKWTGSTRCSEGTLIPAARWRKAADEWTNDPRDQRAPVDGFREHDAVILDKVTLERTLSLPIAFPSFIVPLVVALLAYEKSAKSYQTCCLP
jgi:hypothetical protein